MFRRIIPLPKPSHYTVLPLWQQLHNAPRETTDRGNSAQNYHQPLLTAAILISYLYLPKWDKK